MERSQVEEAASGEEAIELLRGFFLSGLNQVLLESHKPPVYLDF